MSIQNLYPMWSTIRLNRQIIIGPFFVIQIRNVFYLFEVRRPQVSLRKCCVPFCLNIRRTGG